MNGMYAFSKLEMVWSTIKSCDKQSAQKQKVVWIDESGYETKINIEKHWFESTWHTYRDKQASFGDKVEWTQHVQSLS